MSLIALSDLLAQVPDNHVYFSIVNLVTLAVFFTIWILFAQWIDKDALLVNTWRVPWNLSVMGSGIIAACCLLFIPMFAVGLTIYIVVNGAVMTAYIVHRNGLVTDETKVFTPAHIQRLLSEGLGGKKKVKEVKERVRLTDANGDHAVVPVDPIERERYAVAQELVFDALWRRASHVEVTPGKEVSKVSYTIDGVKTEREALPLPEAEAAMIYFKTIAGLNVEEKRKPQLGKIDAKIGETEAVIEVRTGGSTAGERLDLCIIGQEAHYKIEQLGFSEEQLAQVRELLSREKGVLLISGPDDSGLSTTFYSVARSLDAFLSNIQMLAITQEFKLDNITQRIFKGGGDATFAGELQKIVRSDPDVLFFPELPDSESAVLACKAAIHKQRVFTTAAGEDVFEGLKRWMALVNETALLAQSLLGVLNQRLVRVLCSECKQPYKPDSQMLRKANLPQDKVFHRPPEQQYDKHGNPIICQNCHGTGYVGRTGVFDVLLVDDGLREVLRNGGSVSDVRTYVTQKGATGIQKQALSKVLDGSTSIQEVLRVTRKQAAASGKSAAAKPRSKRSAASSAR